MAFKIYIWLITVCLCVFSYAWLCEMYIIDNKCELNLGNIGKIAQ